METNSINGTYISIIVHRYSRQKVEQKAWENYQEMKDSDDGEGQEGIEATLKQVRGPSKDDDGVIGDRDNSGDEEDHQVTQEFEAGA